MPKRIRSTKIRPESLIPIALCLILVVWLAAYPFCRAFILSPIDYNEGWNAYNAQKVATHQLLYPSQDTWTIVNYPPLSFHLMAAAERITGDLLFTGRVLSLASLLISAIFAGLIVRHLTRSKSAASLCGMFVVALFCAADSWYVGTYDPQMLAQAFFVVGIYVYLRGDRRTIAIAAATLLFVVGGNIKHNMLEFPLAVLVDLLLVSRRKALFYAGVGAALAAVSIALTSHFDGAGYLASLLAPRAYIVSQARDAVIRTLLTTLPATVAAFGIAPLCWKGPNRRLLVLLFFFALTIGSYFSGGDGVDINIFFGYTISVALLAGIFWSSLPALLPARFKFLSGTAILCLFFLYLPLLQIKERSMWPGSDLRADRAAAKRFAVEAAFLRGRPGPAMTDRARAGQYAAIMMYSAPERATNGEITGGLFPESVLAAVLDRYEVGLFNEDGVIYVPKKTDAQLPGLR